MTPPYQSFRRRRNPFARAHGQNNLDPSGAPRRVSLVSIGHCSFLHNVQGPKGLLFACVGAFPKCDTWHRARDCFLRMCFFP